MSYKFILHFANLERGYYRCDDLKKNNNNQTFYRKNVISITIFPLCIICTILIVSNISYKNL